MISQTNSKSTTPYPARRSASSCRRRILCAPPNTSQDKTILSSLVLRSFFCHTFGVSLCSHSRLVNSCIAGTGSRARPQQVSRYNPRSRQLHRQDFRVLGLEDFDFGKEEIAR